MKWWQTDCAYCKKLRLIVLWGVIMYVVLEVFWW